jgi:SPP1 family predicted phage head-tail adaptor
MRLVGQPETGQPGADMHADLGAMRERVTLKIVTRTKDAGGFATDTATDDLTVAAAVQIISGDTMEGFLQSGMKGRVVIRIRIRYRAEVTSIYQVRWQGRDYEVLQPPVNLDGKRRFLWVLASTIAGAVETT